RAEGARDGHGALMADAFTDTVLGREGGMEPVTLDLGVMITDRALLDPGCGDLARIEGYGPVPAEALRAELRDALAEPADPAADRYGPDGPQIRVVMRRLYRHPTTGEMVAVESRAREFPPAMRRFLRWRDGTCRAPYCDAPVRHYDHIVPASEGGGTSIDNGQGLCARCNLRQEEASARVERVQRPDEPGHRVAWTGHGGTTVTTSPPGHGAGTPSDEAPHDEAPRDDQAPSASDPQRTTAVADVSACGRTVEITRRLPAAESADDPPDEPEHQPSPGGRPSRPLLDRALGQPGHHPALREQVDDDRRCHRHQIRGEGHVVVVAELGLEHVLQHRDRLQGGVRDDQRRHHEVVPGLDEREDPHRRAHRQIG